MAERIEIIPQKGYQTKALASGADIVIGGGAAGAGKTFGLLMEPVRHIDNPGFGGVIFRRTSPQIRAEGGLWDTSLGMYSQIRGAEPKESVLEWHFKSGAKLKFSHLEYEKNILDWQGSQIAFLGFDELTHFTEKMFFYLLSRNRSTCGVRPYVRATCNPDPESWVAKLIEWWIDQETGLPIPERDGVVRYFIKDGSSYIWGDSEEEVIEKAGYLLDKMKEKTDIDPREFVKSLTFVSGTVYENEALLNVNPGYLANLLSQDDATKAQLLEGNWKIVLNDLDIYDYYSFLGMFENPYSLKSGKKYMTADVALKGSNMFIVGVWDGFELIDITIMPKSDGKEVIEAIKALQVKHQIPNNRLVYDNDGVGGFIDGFIIGAIPFHNGSPALNGEKYKHLKAQCYYKSGDRVNAGGYKVSPEVASRMYNKNQTVRQRFLHERKAIKRDKIDDDGKLCIIGKEEMKVKLGGDSPDLMDMFMMREYFELAPQLSWIGF